MNRRMIAHVAAWVSQDNGDSLVSVLIIQIHKIKWHTESL